MTGRRGFTLIEILVSMVILALLVGLIQGIYTAVAKSRKSAETATEGYHSASAAIQRLADELAMSFYSLERPDETAFKALSGARGLSALEFASRVAAVQGIRTGGDVKLYYELAADREAGDGVYTLRRTEMPDLFGSVSRDGITYDMLKGVRLFKVECFDGNRWQEQWDSARPPVTNQFIPKAVRVEVAWGPKGAEDILRTSTPVYGN